MQRPARSPRSTRHGALALALVALGCDPGEPAAPSVPGDMARRLSQSEYEATVRDLLAVEAGLAREFPSDPPALGFDTLAATQVTSPLLVQLYQHSAEAIAAAALKSPAARAALWVCTPDPSDPAPCVSQIVEQFAARAWRRPPSDAELARLLALHAGGADVDAGLQRVIEAVLLSPHFAFRWERDDGPPGSSHWLDDHALAARLSYFLWSGPPDLPIMSLATAGALQDPDTLGREVLRMLADPRADRFVDGFAGQWLLFRGLDDVFRDAHRYPEFDDDLRASLREGLRRRFAEFLQPGRDFRDLLTDTGAHVDAALATAVYRLDGAAIDEFVRLDLADHRRRGLLTEPGLLTVLSVPFASSPTRRGRFVLENLLCDPLPPPPPGALTEDTSEASTARERLDAHQADPACAGCHAILDPIGLAFEHYDAIGAWRGSEHGESIDSSGQLPDGRSFADVRELAPMIASDPRFSRCVATRLMTYALGRELVADDRPTLDEVHARFVAAKYDFVALLVAVVQTPAFRARRSQERE